MKKFLVSLALLAGILTFCAQGMQSYCETTKKQCDTQAYKGVTPAARNASLKQCIGLRDECLKGKGQWAAQYNNQLLAERQRQSFMPRQRVMAPAGRGR